VTFDLDDTLWDNGPVLADANAKMYQWLHTHCPALTARYSSDRLLQLKQTLVKRYPPLQHQVSQLRITAVQEALLASGISATRAKTMAREAFHVFLEARHRIRFFEHTAGLLAHLSQNYRLGALTNGNADIFRLPVGPYFEYALKAESINISKPDPAFYRHAAQDMGTRPEAMIHIGNSPYDDVDAARKAGMKTIWYNGARLDWPAALSPADETAYDLQEISGLIDKLVGAAAPYMGRLP
jgi:putative hydrolase of the HAD superfamily